MKDNLKKHLSENEWASLERVAEEQEDNGHSKDELLLRMASNLVAEKKSITASYRVLRKYGWDKELVVGALETGMGEPGLKAIERLAKKLWIELGVYDVIEKEGVTHPSNQKILPISLIKFLATRLLQRMIIHDGKVPVFLMFLIKDLLDVKGYGHNQVRAPHQEKSAVFYFAENADRTVSEVAKLIEVDKATVTRWLQDPDFIARVEVLKNDEHKLAYQSWALERGLNLSSDWGE